jgi:hypothetical protein
MLTKLIFGLIAVALVAAYVVPIALKMRDYSLGAVMALGLVMMIVDMLQSLRTRD